MALKVLVCGGIGFADRHWVDAALSEVHIRLGPVSILIHGRSTRVDRWAHLWAVKRSVACAVAHDGWNGHPASPTQILDTEQPELLVIFPGGRSTAALARLGKRRGLRVETA